MMNPSSSFSLQRASVIIPLGISWFTLWLSYVNEHKFVGSIYSKDAILLKLLILYSLYMFDLPSYYNPLRLVLRVEYHITTTHKTRQFCFPILLFFCPVN